MPNLANFAATRPLKILYLGDAGSGKTGSLASLVSAGFKLRIWDFDNLLEPLFQFVQKNCSDKAANVAFQTFTDNVSGANVSMIGGALSVNVITQGTPAAFMSALKQLDYWKTPEEDLGKPSDWGKDTFVVLDTLTQMSNAAFRYCDAMNPGAKEKRQIYFAAQQLVKTVLAKLFSKQFHPNVIINAHLDYSQNHMDLTKGFPRSVGSALNTEIASYFNCVLLAETRGSGTSLKRVIRTNSTGIVDLKNPVSFRVPDELPLENGLATFVQAVRGEMKP